MSGGDDFEIVFCRNAVNFNGDEDGDGVSDAMEVVCGTDPYDAGSVPTLPLAAWPVAVAILCAGLLVGRKRRRPSEEIPVNSPQ